MFWSTKNGLFIPCVNQTIEKAFEFFNMNEQRRTSFNKQLLNHIEHYRNVKASLILNKDLARAQDDYGTLLHYAAKSDNFVIAQELMQLGAEVDSPGHDGKTPLMLAIIFGHAATVRVLLEAKASIDLADNDGHSVLQMALDLDLVNSKIYEIFAHILNTESRTTEELAVRLIASGCNLYHAAVLRNLELMNCMLELGIDMESRGYRERTALHAAAELKDLDMARWLINRGADIDAFDVDGVTVLIMSAELANSEMVKFLLEHGADPNCIGNPDDYTALRASFYTHISPVDKVVDVIELILQYGGTVKTSESFISMFCDTFLRSEDYSINKIAELLLAHLAMLEMLGTSIIKTVLHSASEEYNRAKISKFEKYAELCTRVLKTAAFENLSLFDLFQADKKKMRLLVRKETFADEIEKFCSERELRELSSYYYNLLMKNIAEASRVVELEDEAISVICQLFEGNYNQCYPFAKRVVGYLNVPDLQNLVQV